MVMMVMDMMEFKNLLMLGCLICCMSPCMSQTCIDDKLNNQLQCRYDCSDTVIRDKCSQYNATIHPSIDGYCCPGYFLTNVTKPTCQICRDNTFVPDINKCCGCIICMECDRTREDSIVDPCTNKTNKQCKIEQDPTTPADVACPFIMTSTGNPPTTKEVYTVQVTSTSDVSVPVLESKSERTYRGGFITMLVLFFVPFLVVAALYSCCCCAQKCRAQKCCAHTCNTDMPNMSLHINNLDQTDEGRIDDPFSWRNVRDVIKVIVIGKASITRHQSGSQPQSGYIYQPQSGSISQPQSGSITQPQSGSISQPQSGSITQPQSGSISQPQSGSITQPQSGSISQPQSRSRSESGSQSESGLQTQSEANNDGIDETDGFLKMDS